MYLNKPPTLTHSVIESFLKNARATPFKVALFYENQRITYQETQNNTMKMAGFLANNYIRQGDRVLIYAKNHPNFIYLYLAVHLISAIAVPVDPEINSLALSSIMVQTTPALSLKNIEEIEFDQFHYYGLASTINADDIADILYTSGTTGQPKGVVLTHKAIMGSANHINFFIKNTAEDIEIITAPLCHSFGLGRLRCILVKGGALVLTNKLNSMNSFFHALQNNLVSGISLVPAGVAILLTLTKNKIAEFANQIKYIELGSSFMSAEHKLKLLELLPDTRIYMHYGLTEASRSTFIQLSKDHLNSVGRASIQVAIKIIDEAGNECLPGQIGELCIKGPHIMREYWNNPELTHQTIYNGWLHSGDIAYRDKAGFVYLQGRKNDMINVGGKKVIPDEVEYHLSLHPAIRECACFAISCPKDIMGEVVKAIVVLAPNEKHPPDLELTNFLRERLEAYKIPAVYEWSDTVPRTHTGKVQRSLLRAKEPSVSG